jgi:hypothetical protein
VLVVHLNQSRSRLQTGSDFVQELQIIRAEQQVQLRRSMQVGETAGGAARSAPSCQFPHSVDSARAALTATKLLVLLL